MCRYCANLILLMKPWQPQANDYTEVVIKVLHLAPMLTLSSGMNAVKEEGTKREEEDQTWETEGKQSE